MGGCQEQEENACGEQGCIEMACGHVFEKGFCKAAFGAGIGRVVGDESHGGPAERGCDEQSLERTVLEDEIDGCCLDEDCEDQSKGAECADAAVFHDLESAVGSVSAPEAVGHVGEPVEVKASSEDGEACCRRNGWKGVWDELDGECGGE